MDLSAFGPVFLLVLVYLHGPGLTGISTIYFGTYTKPGGSTDTTDADGIPTGTNGGMILFIEEGLLTETGQLVSVSENLIRAHTGLVQRLVVIPVGSLKGVRGNHDAVLLKDQEASTDLREE